MDSDESRPGFRILGPLEATVRGERVELGPGKQRTVLGLLLCRANHVVPVGQLRDTLWPDDPPRTAHKNLQGYVSTLRRITGAALHHQPPGYSIRVGPAQLDALSFLDLMRRGAEAARGGDLPAAAGTLGRAIGMWRGQVLADLADVPGVRAERERLHEHFLGAFETWMEARLGLGEHGELTAQIDEMVRRYPLRERLRHAQMLALYRCGRQAEALAAYDSLRQVLARELGLPPSPVLTRLYESILVGDPDLEPPREATGLSACLPSDVDDFVGRAREIEVLVTELENARPGRVVVVGGPAGVGKTALVVHCLHRLAGRFPERRFVDLRGGRRPAAGDGGLLVLDDATSEAQVRDAGRGAVVLVTSRSHLAGLESARHLVLDPLPEEDAVELLTRILGRERVAGQLSGARALADACEGLPLAIRIAGARLTVLRHLALARYADRLADDSRVLDELVAGDLDIRARLATWYDDLAPADRDRAHQVAELPDPVPVDDNTERALERLLETHLVRVRNSDVEAHAATGTTSYVVPRLMRTYLRARRTARSGTPPAGTPR